MQWRLSMKTANIIKDFKNLEDVFDFSNLNGIHEKFSNNNEKVIGKFKIKTHKKVWVDECVCLRSKACSFNCKNNIESKNNLKAISQSQLKHLKFEEFYNCLFGEDYQKECDNYILRSIDHEMYLQKKRSSLSIFDDKRCYEDIIKSRSWNWNLWLWIIEKNRTL